MKKLILSTIVASLLAGCGGGSSDENSTNQTPAQAQTPDQTVQVNTNEVSPQTNSNQQPPQQAKEQPFMIARSFLSPTTLHGVGESGNPITSTVLGKLDTTNGTLTIAQKTTDDNSQRYIIETSTYVYLEGAWKANLVGKNQIQQLDYIPVLPTECGDAKFANTQNLTGAPASGGYSSTLSQDGLTCDIISHQEFLNTLGTYTNWDNHMVLAKDSVISYQWKNYITPDSVAKTVLGFTSDNTKYQ